MLAPMLSTAWPVTSSRLGTDSNDRLARPDVADLTIEMARRSAHPAAAILGLSTGAEPGNPPDGPGCERDLSTTKRTIRVLLAAGVRRRDHVQVTFEPGPRSHVAREAPRQ